MPNLPTKADKSKIGTMVCHKSEIQIRPDYEGDVLTIDFLIVINKNKGFGSKILKFSEEYSKRIGCKEFMTLKADSGFPRKEYRIFFIENLDFLR